jgi:hypothetical protein
LFRMLMVIRKKERRAISWGIKYERGEWAKKRLRVETRESKRRVFILLTVSSKGEWGSRGM